MKITITEALRLKNEISSTIKNLNYKINSASLGTLTENDIDVTREEVSFIEVEKSLINGLKFSAELNDTISQFNKENKVDSIVRAMQNAKLLLNVYSNNLARTKPTKQNRFETFSTERKIVVINYTPYISTKEMKEKISTQKNISRELQSKIEKINQEEIEVSFTYEDIENILN